MPQARLVIVGGVGEELRLRVRSLPLPGEEAVVRAVRRQPAGRAANQAFAARRLGAEVALVGRAGDTPAARSAEGRLQALGVNVSLRREEGEGGWSIVAEEESGELMGLVLPQPALEPADVTRLVGLLGAGCVLVTSCAQLSAEARHTIAAAVREREGTLLLDAWPVDDQTSEMLAGFDAAVVGRYEAEALTGVGIANVEDALAALRGLREGGVRDPVVSLGRGGVVVSDRGRGVHVPFTLAAESETATLGDAFVGALATFLGEGTEMGDAVAHAARYASLAALAHGGPEAWPDRAALQSAG